MAPFDDFGRFLEETRRIDTSGFGRWREQQRIERESREDARVRNAARPTLASEFVRGIFDPPAQDETLFGDLTDRPVVGSAVNLLENFTTERLAQTPQDEFTPGLDIAGNVVGSLSTAFGSAPKVAAGAARFIPKAAEGARVSTGFRRGMATGATLGAGTAMQQQGFENPSQIAQSALLGAAGGALPINNARQLAGSMGYDLFGTAQQTAQDPVAIGILDKMQRGEQVTDEEKVRLATIIGSDAVASLAGNAAAFAAARAPEYVPPPQPEVVVRTGGDDVELMPPSDMAAAATETIGPPRYIEPADLTATEGSEYLLSDQYANQPRDMRRSPGIERLAGVVDIEPIRGEKPLPFDIIDSEIAKRFGLTPRVGQDPAAKKRGAAGTYVPQTMDIQAADRNLTVRMHEVAHALDDKHGVMAQTGGLRDPELLAAVEKELAPHAARGSKPPEGATQEQARAYTIGEGFAEWLFAYTVNPEQAVKQAPTVARIVETRLPDQVLEDLRWVGRQMRVRMGAHDYELIAAQHGQFPTQRSTVVGAFAGSFRHLWEAGQNKFLELMIDDYQPLWTALQPLVKQGVMSKGSFRALQNRVFGHERINSKIFYFTTHRLANHEGRPLTEGGINWVMDPLKDVKYNRIRDAYAKVVAAGASEQAIARYNRRAENVALKNAENEKTIAELTERRETLPTSHPERKRINQRIRAQKSAISRRNNALQEWGRSKLLGVGSDGLGKGDIDVAMAALAELRNDADWPVFQEHLRRYREYAAGVVEYLVGARLLSLEEGQLILRDKDAYRAMNRLDVSLYGEMNAKTGGRRGGKLGAPDEGISRFRGSDRMIDDPTASLMNNMARAVRAADANHIMMSLVDSLRVMRNMHEGQPVDTAQIMVRTTKQTDKTVKVIRDGEVEYWEVQDPDLRRMFKVIERGRDDNILNKVTQKFADVMRWHITNSIGFINRQIPRDAQSRVLVSRTSGFGSLLGAIPHRKVDAFGSKMNAREMIKGYSDQEEYALAIHGGMTTTLYHSEPRYWQKRTEETLREFAQNKGEENIVLDILGPAKNAKRFVEGVSQWSELSNRMVEWRNAFDERMKMHEPEVKAGRMDPEDAKLDAERYAAGETADLMDFQRMGSLVRSLKNIVLFLAPAMRGMHRTYTALRENPSKFVITAGILALPKLIADAWNMTMGEETFEEYMNQPAHLKDLFWSFKVGPNTWVRIPKSYEAGIISAWIGRGIDKYFHGRDDAFYGHAAIANQVFNPFGDVSLGFFMFQPISEVQMNRDMFRNKFIIPPWEEGLALEERSTERASRFGQVAQKLTGMDARNIDHLVRGYFSQYGQLVLTASDLGREDRGAITTSEALRRTTGLTATSPGWNSEPVQRLLQRAQQSGEMGYAEMNGLKQLRDAYYQANTDTERDRLARLLRKEAERLLRIYDQRGTLKKPEPIRSSLPRLSSL